MAYQDTPLQLLPGSLGQLLKFAEGGYLYAILDACDAPLVQKLVQELGTTRAISLFAGIPEAQHWTVSPCLVQADPALLRWVVESLWTQPWGVFVMSRAQLPELFEHFRRFLVTELPDGRRFFFRYYDPRVLKQFLSQCQPEHVHEFFGPVRAFAINQNDDISFFMLNS
jgi:hypothetical protein